jgi:hypothetical protein
VLPKHGSETKIDHEVIESSWGLLLAVLHYLIQLYDSYC